jgi:hypothetical protein
MTIAKVCRFRVGVWGDDDGGGDLVVGVEVEELDAGGASDWSGLGWKQPGHTTAVWDPDAAKDV